MYGIIVQPAVCRERIWHRRTTSGVVGHPSNQAARGALQEELLSQTHKGAHNRIGVQFLCDPETESVDVRIWRHNDRVHAPFNDNGRLTCGHDHL